MRFHVVLFEKQHEILSKRHNGKVRDIKYAKKRLQELRK